MEKADCLARAREVLDLEVAGIAAVRDALDGAFIELVEACLDAYARSGKIVITGVGKSGHIGQKMAATLSSTGSPAAFMHPVEAMHGDLGVLAGNDLLVALSFSGETEELLNVLPSAKRFRVPIAAITGGIESTLARWSDITVPLPVAREACPFNLAPTTSTTATLALGDALAIVLLERRGFDKEDYAKLHPAGAIGRSITLRVSDIMRTGDKAPCVRGSVRVAEALAEMTRARCGSVMVVDAEGVLEGIFTDGDFRRHVTRDAACIESELAPLMTTRPTTVHPQMMAVELLALLEDRRIDDVPVIDGDGKAVGLVDIQDLPKFKIL
jgi:arabinose-5-phosphate isomerase